MDEQAKPSLEVGEGDNNAAMARMAETGGNSDALVACINGCAGKTTDTGTYLSCVRSCDNLFGSRLSVYGGGSRIVIIG